MILVTGATGFVGRSLMQALARQERPARAYQGRINNPHSLRQQLAGVDTVIHLASGENRGRARALQHIDVEGTERVLEECRHAGIALLLLLSRLGAEASAMYPLFRAKGEQERLVQRSGLPAIIIRSATLYGRHDRFLNHIVGLARWSWPLVWLPGGGHTPMQPLWVEDLVHCLVLALDRPDLVGQTLSLGGEERLHYAGIVRLALEAAGIRAIPFKPHPVLVRPLVTLFFGWWRRPPISRLLLDRLSVPDIAELDGVHTLFRFRPGRLERNIGYLRRPGLRWRVLGLRRD